MENLIWGFDRNFETNSVTASLNSCVKGSLFKNTYGYRSFELIIGSNVESVDRTPFNSLFLHRIVITAFGLGGAKKNFFSFPSSIKGGMKSVGHSAQLTSLHRPNCVFFAISGTSINGSCKFSTPETMNDKHQTSDENIMDTATNNSTCSVLEKYFRMVFVNFIGWTVLEANWSRVSIVLDLFSHHYKILTIPNKCPKHRFTENC